ncbi:MAG: hypothetical protein A2054_01215 [Deltaproteobacteria bacterium GWA2_55_10]|nr:MAG: hypothetical protein A2054_01215 [Deltaproteobacteria bacterium GWA2_55_10]
MNILYLSHKNPVLEDEGAKIVIMGTLRHLAKKGCRITLVYLDQDGVGRETLSEFCEEAVPVPHRPGSMYSGMAMSMLAGMPYSVWMFRNRAFRQALRETVKRRSFDLVHMETALLQQYADCLRPLPILIRHHNLEADLLLQRARAEKNAVNRMALSWQGKRLASFEADAVNSTERSVTISAVDKARIIEAYGCKPPIDVIPSGIETSNETALAQREHCLVFSGRIEWGPNAEGIEWFVRNVFPIIVKKFPQLKLYIVGGAPPKRIRELGCGSIKVTGFVESVIEFIDRAEVYVVPLLSGSGMRLKILEAMSRKKAIVSTSKGAEGISCRNGRDLMIADAPEDFARAVIGLLSDKDKNARMGQEAFRTVREHYSWESVADSFIAAYEEMLANGRVRPHSAAARV